MTFVRFKTKNHPIVYIYYHYYHYSSNEPTYRIFINDTVRSNAIRNPGGDRESHGLYRGY